ILRQALGFPIASLDRERAAAGVMMIPIPRAGRLNTVRGRDAAAAVPCVEEVVITAHVGQELVPLPEGWQYLGFIFSRAETPGHAALLAGFTAADGDGVAGAVCVSRRAEFIRDVQRDPRWLQRRLLEAAELHACAACPLISQERALGVLIVLFGRRAGFTREERELVGLLASQAAIAIENARLYEEAERQRRE